jgi:hypothetical protein
MCVQYTTRECGVNFTHWYYANPGISERACCLRHWPFQDTALCATFIVDLEPLNVITGANGAGKSNLYKALRLLANIAHGHIVRTIAQEGGFPSTFWAGPELAVL